MGFLEITDSKSMLILDGQHRMLALKVMNEQNELREDFKKRVKIMMNLKIITFKR